MKKSCLLLTACFMLLFIIPGCGEQEPTSTSREPVFPESELTSVLFMDNDETWYLLQEGDSGLSEASDILGSIRGREIQRPEDGPAGSYTFDVTYGGETHSLSMTGNSCVLDGVWYDVEQGCDAALAECLRGNGTVIPKEEWSHSAKWLSPEMYFWKNTEVTCSAETICYAEAPWASDKSYTDNEMTALGILPELDGYTSQSLCVYYNEDGSVWEMIAHWQYYDEAEPSAYKQLELEIWPEKPGEDEAIDGMITFDPDKLTETKIRDSDGNLISVYGDGTLETRCKYLIFTLADGSYCQITAFDTVDAGDMAVILEYLVTNGVDYTKRNQNSPNTYDEITGETVTAEGPYGSIQLTIPEGWGYKVNTVADCEESDMDYGCYSISIGPEACDGSAVILCDPNFAVCGTGLTEETVEIAGREARIGSYGGPAPAFILFRGDFSNIAVRLFSASDWWNDMQQEILSILDTLVYDINDQSGAIGIYGDGACVSELDLELSAKNVSASGATICFQQFDGISLADTTEIWTGRAFTLERRNGDLWENVDIAIEGDYAFTEEGLILSHGAVTELRYDWAWLYGELPAGDYRMKLTIWVDATPDDDGYTDKVDAYAYFIIR